MRERIAFLSLIVLFVGFAVCLGLMAEANWDDIRKANAQQNCDEVQTFTGNGIKETQPFTLTSDTWRLRYNFESSTPDQQSSSFDMSVYKTGNTIPESVITLDLRKRRSRYLLPKHRVRERNVDCNSGTMQCLSTTRLPQSSRISKRLSTCI
jgi:hypothetical protein